jgi:hypothetical protein
MVLDLLAIKIAGGITEERLKGKTPEERREIERKAEQEIRSGRNGYVAMLAGTFVAGQPKMDRDNNRKLQVVFKLRKEITDRGLPMPPQDTCLSSDECFLSPGRPYDDQIRELVGVLQAAGASGPVPLIPSAHLTDTQVDLHLPHPACCFDSRLPAPPPECLCVCPDLAKRVPDAPSLSVHFPIHPPLSLVRTLSHFSCLIRSLRRQVFSPLSLSLSLATQGRKWVCHSSSA